MGAGLEAATVHVYTPFGSACAIPLNADPGSRIASDWSVQVESGAPLIEPIRAKLLRVWASDSVQIPPPITWTSAKQGFYCQVGEFLVKLICRGDSPVTRLRAQGRRENLQGYAEVHAVVGLRELLQRPSSVFSDVEQGSCTVQSGDFVMKGKNANR